MVVIELTDAQMELLSGGYESDCYDERLIARDIYQEATPNDIVAE